MLLDDFYMYYNGGYKGYFQLFIGEKYIRRHKAKSPSYYKQITAKLFKLKKNISRKDSPLDIPNGITK